MHIFDNAENGNRDYKGFQLKRTDPYGFWIITKNNRIFKEFEKHSFTDTRTAISFIDSYLAKKA